jgi:hypothetical protein
VTVLDLSLCDIAADLLNDRRGVPSTHGAACFGPSRWLRPKRGLFRPEPVVE